MVMGTQCCRLPPSSRPGRTLKLEADTPHGPRRTDVTALVSRGEFSPSRGVLTSLAGESETSPLHGLSHSQEEPFGQRRKGSDFFLPGASKQYRT